MLLSRWYKASNDTDSGNADGISLQKEVEKGMVAGRLSKGDKTSKDIGNELPADWLN